MNNYLFSIKINFQGNRAVSVIASPEHNFKETYEIYAGHEIILSAGAFQSPQLLKLSGIGSAKELAAFKISPIVVDSPQVGENLYDHMNVPIYVSINESLSVNADKILSIKELWNYVVKGHGIFGRFGVTGFVNKQDAHYGVGLFGAGSIDEDVLRDISNAKKDVSTFFDIIRKP